MRINPWHAEYFIVLTFHPNFYPVNLQHSSCKHAFLIEWKTVDPDQVASTMYSKRTKFVLSRTWVKY